MRYAITDIHGGSKTFRALLERVNLHSGDILFLLGDYVDRGPDSFGVLEVIIELMNAGYDVRPLRGNHDEMLLRTLLGEHDMFSSLWLDEWGKQTLQSFGNDKSKELSNRYVKLLESMPYIFVEPDFVFVHAGLNMSVNDPIHNSDVIEMLWNRSGFVDYLKLGGRQLVTGHTIETIDVIRNSLNTAHIRLDNGAFTQRFPEMGNLVALNLDTKELIIQQWCDIAAIS